MPPADGLADDLTDDLTDEEVHAIEQSSPQVAGIGVAYPGDLRFLLAFAGGFNQKFAEVFSDEITPYITAIAADALTEETARRILSRVYVRSIILDWESDDPDNQPPPLTDVNAAAKWLRSDQVMFEDIEGVVTDPTNFRREPDGDDDFQPVCEAHTGCGENG